jgi:casein kinase II subunit alpha
MDNDSEKSHGPNALWCGQYGPVCK